MGGINQAKESQNTLTDIDLAEHIAKLFGKLKKVKWSNERIQNELGRRTIEAIISSGESCYMGACVDFSLAFLMELKKILPQDKLAMGCELLRRKSTGNYGFHLFLKDNSVQPSRIIDFMTKNEVSIYEGVYTNSLNGTELDQLALYELSAQEVNAQDSFLSLVQKMNINLPPELFQAYLSKLQQDNTDAQFEKFQANSPRIVKIHGNTQEQTKHELLSSLMEESF
ncbi:MAG: hypothetical protein ACFN4U_01545 [Candidatus Absconditicoccaceae bacterium]